MKLNQSHKIKININKIQTTNNNNQVFGPKLDSNKIKINNNYIKQQIRERERERERELKKKGEVVELARRRKKNSKIVGYPNSPSQAAKVFKKKRENKRRQQHSIFYAIFTL